MAFKFVAILALVGVVAAGVVPVPQVYHQYAAPTAATATYAVKAAAPALVAHTPVAYAHPAPAVAYSHAPTTVVKSLAYAPHPHTVLAKHEEEYFDAHPQYKYNYNVQDDITGDSKSQTEERDGDVVTGEYSLIDADGYRRVVQYTADAVHGFNAVVNRIPLEHVKTVVKAIAPVATYAHAPAVAAPIAVAPYHAHHH